jgi:hypothetical protein
MTREFSDFEDFFPWYVGQHSKRAPAPTGCLADAAWLVSAHRRGLVDRGP